MKDVVTALRLEMSELTSIVKAMMMALGNNSEKGGLSEQRGKVKVPNLRAYARERDA